MDRTHPALAAFLVQIERAVAPLPVAVGPWADAAEVRVHDKGADLLRAGDVAGHLYFVHKGLLRYYFVDPDSGDERTGQFFDEGSVYTDVASFIARVPATQSVQALERSEILRLPRSAIYAAYDADRAFERFGRLMLEEALVGSQRRATNLLTLTPEERYRWFVAARPEVARRVPQYLIASYLGVTPEALSRIRGRAARKA